MYFYLSLAFAAVAVALIFAPDRVLDKNSVNKYVQMVHKNSKAVGVFCVALAYYLYSCCTSGVNTKSTDTTTSTTDSSNSSTWNSLSVPITEPTSGEEVTSQ